MNIMMRYANALQLLYVNGLVSITFVQCTAVNDGTCHSEYLHTGFKL